MWNMINLQQLNCKLLEQESTKAYQKQILKYNR